MEFNQYIALIVFSLIVMISHVFDVVSKKLKVPSVLLLMGFGIILQHGSMIFDLPVFSVTNYLKVFGTVGLILIVLESALDLQIKRSNFRIVEKSFGAALGILLVSVGFLSLFFYYWMGADIQSAVINAIPLAVISSAVVISSTAHLAPKKREFLTYESIFSDILGIMLFTLILELDVLALKPIVSFGVNIIFVTIISVVCSAALIFSLNKIKAQAKFFIILSFLVFMYSIGRLFHLSSLLLVLIFGLLLNNCENILSGFLPRFVDMNEFDDSRSQFKLIIAESAFLIRTFFFVIFGYSVNLGSVWSMNVLRVGFPVVLILLLIRFMYLKVVVRTHVFPELFFAPKGLITILLYYSIPTALLIGSFSEGEVFFVILVTSLLMMLGGSTQRGNKVFIDTKI